MHLDNFLQLSLLEEAWITVEPPTELLLEGDGKHKRATLLLHPGCFISRVFIANPASLVVTFLKNETVYQWPFRF